MVLAFSGAQGVLRVGVCPSVRCTYTCRRSRVRDCSRGGEWDAESESEEREKGGGGGRGNSAALPSDCVVKGVQPSPVGPHTRGLRGDRGEGNQPALRHTPTSDVAQHTTDSESDSNWCSNTPHRLLIILPAVFSFTPWLMWADCRAPTLLLILLPPPQHLPFLSSSSIPFFLLSRLFLPSPPPGTFLLCLLSKAPTS